MDLAGKSDPLVPKKNVLVLAISAVSLQYHYNYYNGKNMASSEFDQTDSSNCQGDRLQYYAASAPCINHRQCLKSSRRDHATSQDLKFLLPKLYIIL